MKKPYENGFDAEFLTDHSRWGRDLLGNRRCHVKSQPAKPGMMSARFGIVYESDPLVVQILRDSADPEGTITRETFPNIVEMAKVWMVD